MLNVTEVWRMLNVSEAWGVLNVSEVWVMNVMNVMGRWEEQEMPRLG